MALRGKAPEVAEKRLKLFIYGNAGAGKTLTSVQFPRPYLIDTERGSENDQYVQELAAGSGAVFKTSEFSEMVSEVKELLSTKHDFKTLIIDPITTTWNDVLDKAEVKYGTTYGKHHQVAGRQMRGLMNLLLRLDMNVIVTSHAKTPFREEGAPKQSDTFDAWRKLDYIFDLVIEVQRLGSTRTGIVRKSRIESFPGDLSFPFSYGEIAARYGFDLLERESTPQELATAEQVIEIEHLLEVLKFDEAISQKWLDKACSSTWSEMPRDTIEKCIAHLHDKVTNKG